MNIANFKIRNRLLQNVTNRLDQLENIQRQQPFLKKNKKLQPINSPDDRHKFTQLISSFESAMGSLLTQVSNIQLQQQKVQMTAKNTANNNTPLPEKAQVSYEVQPRDRYVMIDLPDLQVNKLDRKKLKLWLGNVCRQTFSSAFNYYNSGKLNYEQSKVFASESILRNLILIEQKYRLDADEIKFLDHLMKYELLPYLKSKYPMTISKNGNKMLAKIIKKVDNSDLLANDLFSITEIKFQTRETERYDDLIMKLLNEIMMRADQKPNEASNQTNFQDFQNFMTQIFQKVYDQKWTDSNIAENNIKSQHRIGTQQANNRRKSFINNQMILMTAELEQNAQMQKQKYKKEVQQYTDFTIGRKISQDIQLFTESQIQSGALRIKSPAILRLLTKWCDQLWRKFEDPNYFYLRNEGFLSKQSKQIRVLSPRQKDFLAQKAQQLKTQIQSFLGEVMNQNYLQQFYQLQRQIQDKSQVHIQPLQKICGKFSLKVADNLESFIIVYLNKLIHCLLILSQKEYQGSQSEGSKVQLLSFKIGDLLRCKLSTKERQIKKVYQQIQRVSALNQEKIKIIRIKNRLELGTNDILINVKFNSLIICQIQLTVLNSSKTEFIKHSYNFNHYIYELERSIFGPITQMCSVWKNFQGRAKQVQKLIDRQANQRMNKIIEDSQCVKLKAEHFMQAQIYPFICSQCSKSYYHNTCIFDHQVCLNCYYWVCSYCKVRKCIAEQNLAQFLDERQLIQYCKFWTPNAQKYLPQYGVLINITISGKQSIEFQKITYNSCDYLFRMLDDQFQLYKRVKTAKDRQKLNKTYLILQLAPEKGNTIFKSDTKQIRQKYIIPESIKRGFKNQREIVSIMDEDINEIDMSPFKNATSHEKQLIKSVQFSYTNLQTVQILSKEFVNLQTLYIANNPIQEIGELCKFTYLQKIYASMTRIRQIPESFSNLKYLKELNLSSCRLKQLPSNIDKFQTLVILNASFNQIKQFPQVLSRHRTLQFIDLNQNGIVKMPQTIQNLSNLKKLVIQNNKLVVLPKDMSKMKKLKEFSFMNGKIAQISQSLSTLNKIQTINLSKNKLQKVYFGKPFTKLQHLKTVNLSENILPTVDGSFKNLTYVQNIHLQKNQIANIKLQFFNLEYIKYLDLSQNNLSKFPIIQLKEHCFKDLNFLNLSKNKLTNFPIVFEKCVNIESLNMSDNQLEQVTQSIFDLYKLKNLNLDNNPKIKCIPDTLKKLKKLTTLSFRFNSIQEVPDAVGDLAHLEKLCLDNNKIRQLKPSFFRLKKLYCLSLKFNQIVQLLDQFHKLKKLEELYLEGNKLKQLPNSIGTHIDILIYNDNPIQTYPCRCLQRDSNKILFQNKGMKILKEGIIQNKMMLTSVSFKNNILQEIPHQVFELKNLYELNMSFNRIKTIPEGILNLFTLKSLILSDNMFETLPQFISNFNQLKEIDVYSEYFIQFPTSIEALKLTKIRFNARMMNVIKNIQNIHSDKVDFSNQGLTFLHASISGLTNVDVIMLSQNNLESLPNQFCQLNIKELQITGQKLKELPQNFGRLQKISKLNLSRNQIEKLPESFIQLSNLKEFFIQENKLNALPSGINKITNLRRLNISKNKFQSLDFELQGLVQLQANQNQVKEITKNLISKNCKIFCVEKNQIKKIPKILQKMKQLGLLKISQNPIQQVECTQFAQNRGDKKTKQMINEYCKKVDSQRRIMEIEYS